MKRDYKIVDTNILIGAVAGDLVPESSALWLNDYYSQFGMDKFCIPSPILYELETVFYKVVLKQQRHDPSLQKRLLEKFLPLFEIICQDSLIYPELLEDQELAIEIYSEQKTRLPKLSLIDCYLLAFAKRTKLELMTLDTNLLAAAKKMNLECFTL